MANTPKTLKEIMPVLMNTLITSLASSSSERRQVCIDLPSLAIGCEVIIIQTLLIPLFI